MAMDSKTKLLLLICIRVVLVFRFQYEDIQYILTMKRKKNEKISNIPNLNRGGMLLVSVAAGYIATPIILGQRHSEVGWPAPFFAVFRFPVIDRYPLRLGEPRSGRRAWGSNPVPLGL